MTQVVADAERRNELPPLGMTPADIPATPPRMSDLMAAFALSRLAQALEYGVMLSEPWLPQDTSSPWWTRDPPEDPEYLPEWRVRFCRAIYRTLTVGAALAGSYNEPMFRAPVELGLDKALEMGKLSKTQFDFFQQFAVCREKYNAEADNAVFGPIARWLLADILSNDEARHAMARRFEDGFGRAGYCQSRNGDCPAALATGGTHSDAHLVAWEVMQLLWIQDWIHNSLLRPGSMEYPLHGYPTEDGRYRATEEPPDREVTAAVVLFGVSNTEHISIPEVFTPEDTPVLFAYVNDAPGIKSAQYVLEDGHDAVGRSVQVFFDQIHEHSQRPDGAPRTWDVEGQLRLKFFGYFFRRYLGLQLLSSDDYYTPTLSHEFLRCLTLFSHDDRPRRKAYTHGQGFMTCDFLDGTEMLMKAEVPS